VKTILSFFRITMIGTGLVLIALAVAGVLFAPRLEPLVRGQVEGVLSDWWGSDAQVERIGFSFRDRALELVNVAVAHSPTLPDDVGLQFSRVLVQPDLLSLFSRHPAIEEVRVEGAQVGLPAEGADAQELLDLVEQMELPAKPKAAPAPSGWDFLLKRFTGDGAEVHLQGETRQATPVEHAVEPFDLDAQQTGAATQDLGSMFLQEVVRSLLTKENLQQLLIPADPQPAPQAAPVPP
jgi:hypothetical protein